MVSATFTSIVLAAAACAALVPQVDAHGYIISPKAQTNGKGHPGTFVIEYPPPWTGSWKDPKNFAAAAKEKGFTTLRSYLEDKGATCGFTDPNVAPRAIPADRKVTFSRDMPHPGPCELWIDDKRVYQNDDCESAFAGVIPSWDVDWALCSGECMIRFYWLGLQASGTRWQVYKSCVPVSGTAKATDSGKTTPKPTTKAPSKTPKPTTKAPSKTKTPKPTTEVGGEGETPSSTPKNGTMELDVGCKAKVKSTNDTVPDVEVAFCRQCGHAHCTAVTLIRKYKKPKGKPMEMRAMAQQKRVRTRALTSVSPTSTSSLSSSPSSSSCSPLCLAFGDGVSDDGDEYSAPRVPQRAQNLFRVEDEDKFAHLEQEYDEEERLERDIATQVWMYDP